MKCHQSLLGFAVLLCTTTLSLKSHHPPESFITSLEYRRATEEDTTGLRRQVEGTDFFVAVKRSKMPEEIGLQPVEPLWSQAAVGSVEFGVVAVSQYGEWLYIAHVDTRSDCRGQGVAPQLLRKLLEYIHNKKPEIIGAWMRVETSHRSAISAYTAAGFANAGMVDRFHNFIYAFGPTDASGHSPDDGKPLPDITSLTMRYLFAELIELKAVILPNL